MNQDNKIVKINLIDLCLALLTATLIIVFAFIQSQSFIKTLPTLITLYVQILMVKGNRCAFLIGGINSLIYGIGYYAESLYFSTLSAVAISFPLMIFSFFNWKRKSQGSTTTLLNLKNSARILISIGLIVVWVLCVKLLGDIVSGGRFIYLDCFCFVGGIAVTILSSLRYADSQYLNVLCCTLTLIMWIAVCIEDAKNINFIIISLYNLYKVIQMAISWTKLTKTKNSEA